MLFVPIAFGFLALQASAVLFRHQRLLTYLAAAAALWQSLWLAAGFAHRVWLPGVAAEQVYTAAALAALAAAVLLLKKFRMPTAIFTAQSFRRDLVILPLLAILLISAWLVSRVNYQQDSNFVTHGFFNGDTLTLVSLVQRSRLAEGLLAANPLAGNGPLEYPTLLHGTIADMLELFGAPWLWLSSLPLLTYLQILIITPLFFLLADIVLPPPAHGWQMWLGIRPTFLTLTVQALVIAGLMMLSWDHFIYPQSHFFLFGIFLLGVCSLAVAFTASGRAQWLPLTVGSICMALLYVANAVTGTAALVLLAVFCLLRIATVSQPISDRLMYLILLLACVIWFFLWTPGQSGFGHFNFSYTAAYDMLRLSGLVAVTLAAVWLNRHRHKFLALGAIGLCALALLLFFFSERVIVIDNASRFFYHALIIGSPFILPLLIQLFFWSRRQLAFTSQLLIETMSGIAAVIMLGTITWVLPAGSSVLSAMDNLMYRDTQIVNQGTLAGIDWIAANASPSAIIIASPNAPWTIPFLTGRSLLRVQDYWLSPQDSVLDQLALAFAGDQQAQQQVLRQGDYLLLTRSEQKKWPAGSGVPVFASSAVTIYDLHDRSN